MDIIENDVNELELAISVFQKCVPEMYRSRMDVLVAKYYMSHPSKETEMMIANETAEMIKVRLLKFLKDRGLMK